MDTFVEGLILGVNTLYMFFCFFKRFAVVGNELIWDGQQFVCGGGQFKLVLGRKLIVLCRTAGK